MTALVIWVIVVLAVCVIVVSFDKPKDRIEEAFRKEARLQRIRERYDMWD